MEDRIRARLSANETASVRAKVTVDRRGGVFRVRIRLSGAVDAERVLSAESCDAAAEATALLITLAIQPDAVITAEASSDSTPATPTTGTSNDERSADRDASTRTAVSTDSAISANVEAANDDEEDTHEDTDDDAEEDTDDDAEEDADDVEDDAAIDTDMEPATPSVLALDAGLGVAFDWGTLPGPTAGGLLQLNLAISHVLLSLSGGGWLSRSAAVASDAAVSVGWMSASLDGCYLSGNTWQLGPCLGVELGRYAWNADGLIDTHEGHRLAAFASASFAGRARLTKALYAALWVGVRTSLSYPELLVVGAGEVFSPAPLGFRAAFVLTLVLG